MNDRQHIDLLVRTEAPQHLDVILRSLPGVASVVVEDSWDPQTRVAVVRCFGDLGFLKFAITQQGYGEVVGTLGESPEAPVTLEGDR